MKHKKLTPKNYSEIISRVNSGEKQKDLAEEFDITPGYVSQIIKSSKQPGRSKKNLESVPLDNLFNRLKELSREIAGTRAEKLYRADVAMSLKRQIAHENQPLLESDDAELKKITQASMTATQRMIVWNEDHTTLDASLISHHAEQLAIFREIFRRGQCVPAT